MNFLLRRLPVLLALTGLMIPCFTFATLSALAQWPPESATKPRTLVVTEKPLRIEVELDGVAVANKTAEVKIQPQSWTELTVIEAVKHGKRVDKGDVLIRCDPRKIDLAIEDLESSLGLTDLEIKQAQQEIPLIEKSIDLQRKAAVRANRITKEDTKRQLAVDAPLDKKQADRYLKQSEYSLESALAELNQLKKMYEADDLTEETEEMILRRQRHQVEQAEFSLERARARHEKAMKFSLPRELESVKHQKRVADTAFAQKKLELSVSLKKKQFEVAKKSRERDRSREKLQKLRADRKLLVVRSPAKGIVFYGGAIDGRWSQIGSVGKRLVAKGSLQPNETVMTIVEPKGVYVQMLVPQEKLASLRAGQDAQVSFTALDRQNLDGRVANISEIPVSESDFSARVNLEKDGRVVGLVPGMTGKVRSTVYAQRKAILAPQGALSGGSPDAKNRFVTLVKKDGSQERKRVRIGRKKGDQVEIVRGLKAGDEILLDMDGARKPTESGAKKPDESPAKKKEG